MSSARATRPASAWRSAPRSDASRERKPRPPRSGPPTPQERALRQLETLIADAGGLDADEHEVGRVLQICNACRYCEGFCAVFPAMTRRLEFGRADIHYLANLCHGGGACLHACQYAPPHEFAVSLPKAMARVRGKTYVDYAWPRALGALYRRNGLTLSLALGAGLALFMLLAATSAARRSGPLPGGDFYAVLPHDLLVLLFG